MVYKLYEVNDKVKSLFQGWEETMIYSCLQGVMGKILVTNQENPVSACASVGCFAFYAGIPDQELLEYRQGDFTIMVPENQEWEKLIEANIPTAKKVARYAIRKDTVFDREHLRELIGLLPEGYRIQRIDSGLYDQCLLSPVTVDFVSSFADKEAYLEKGRGIVIMKEGQIAAGASSYARYREGIEIEVDTMPDERRKHLATVACAALILDCLEEGLYPSWDAQNMNSVRLAEKLGYQFSHEYVAYEVMK